MSRSETWPGRPEPPGATWDGSGTNFSIRALQEIHVDGFRFDLAAALARGEFSWCAAIPTLVAPSRLRAASRS